MLKCARPRPMTHGAPMARTIPPSPPPLAQRLAAYVAFGVLAAGGLGTAVAESPSVPPTAPADASATATPLPAPAAWARTPPSSETRAIDLMVRSGQARRARSLVVARPIGPVGADTAATICAARTMRGPGTWRVPAADELDVVRDVVPSAVYWVAGHGGTPARPLAIDRSKAVRELSDVPPSALALCVREAPARG